MGLGGNLMWTAVARAIADRTGRPALFAARPGVTDLLTGRLHDRSVTYRDDPVFRHNPHIAFPEQRPKGALARAVDAAAWRAVCRLGWREAYERLVYRLSMRCSRGPMLCQVDMSLHSYAARQIGTPGQDARLIWKEGGHAAETIARAFVPLPVDPTPTLHFTGAEEEAAAALLAAHGLTDGRFLVVEPETNREFFGDLRAWPLERWQAVVDALQAERPDLPIIQVGLPNARRLEGIVDLCGATDFRTAALVIRAARLFIGTESGLMHTARAVDTDAVILWGGVTLPEFAGYTDVHRILCHYVACAPCGNQGWCPNEHVCMRSITVAEVLAVVRERIGPADRPHAAREA